MQSAAVFHLVDCRRLSCSTICFRNFPLPEALDAIADLGLTHVDLAALPGFCPHFDFVTASRDEERAFVDLVRRSGLSVHTFTTFVGHPNDPSARLDVLLQAARRNIRVARELGAHGITFTCGQYRPRDRHPVADDIDTVAAFLRPLAAECRAAGIHAMVESPHKTSLLRTPEEAALLWSVVDSPDLAPILDVNHYEAAGWSARQAVDFIGAKRIGIVHLRDGVGRENRHVLGTGAIDFAELFRALRDGGYAGRYSFEFSDTTDSVAGNADALRRSIDHLLSLKP
jgi:sugar phosphate isomerase/epimerase